MEYAPNGTMAHMIARQAPYTFSHKQVLRYFTDIVMGLEYLHIRHVIHRDLKPLNLLIDANLNLKIADFGISSIYKKGDSQRDASGTLAYMSPELIAEKRSTCKSDLWSLGCILYEMCMGRPPFSRVKTQTEMYNTILLQCRPYLPCEPIRKTYGDIWATICEKLLHVDASKRISIPEIFYLDANLTLTYYNKYFDYNY